VSSGWRDWHYYLQARGDLEKWNSVKLHLSPMLFRLFIKACEDQKKKEKKSREMNACKLLTACLRG